MPNGEHFSSMPASITASPGNFRIISRASAKRTSITTTARDPAFDDSKGNQCDVDTWTFRSLWQSRVTDISPRPARDGGAGARIMCTKRRSSSRTRQWFCPIDNTILEPQVRSINRPDGRRRHMGSSSTATSTSTKTGACAMHYSHGIASTASDKQKLDMDTRRIEPGWAGSGYGMFTIPRVGHRSARRIHRR